MNEDCGKIILTVCIPKQIVIMAKSTSATRRHKQARTSRVSVGRRHKPKRTFRSYIYRLSRRGFPDIGFSSKAMNVFKNITMDLFKTLFDQANKCANYADRSTIVSRDVEASFKLMLPHNFTKPIAADIKKALERLENHAAGTKGSKKSKSVTDRAGLIFPITRVRGMMRRWTGKNVGVDAAVIGVCAVQYVMELLLLESYHIVVKLKKMRYTPRCILLGIAENKELTLALNTTTIASGGAVEHIHKALLPKVRPSQRSNSIGY